MTHINVVQNDKGYEINFTLKDANEAAIDLTNISAMVFKVQKQGASIAKFSGSMTVVSAPAGTCKYVVATGDFDSAGDYYAEIEATFTGGKVITFGDIIVHAKPEIPR